MNISKKTFVLIGLFVALAISLPLFLITKELKLLNQRLNNTTQQVDNLTKKLGESSLLKF